jgi:hypothetical protein
MYNRLAPTILCSFANGCRYTYAARRRCPVARQRSVPAGARLRSFDQRPAHGPVRSRRRAGMAVLAVSAPSAVDSLLRRRSREGRQLLCAGLAAEREVLAGPGSFKFPRPFRRKINLSSKTSPAETGSGDFVAGKKTAAPWRSCRRRCDWILLEVEAPAELHRSRVAKAGDEPERAVIAGGDISRRRYG